MYVSLFVFFSATNNPVPEQACVRSGTVFTETATDEEYPPVLYKRTYDVHTVNCDAIAVNCMYVVRMYVLLYYLV